MSLRDKLTASFTSEKLGEVQTVQPPKHTKPVKQKQAKIKPKKDITTQLNNLPGDGISAPFPNVVMENKLKRHPVLDMLQISYDVFIDRLITPEEIENTEFSRTAPVGINEQEMVMFCDRVQNDIAQYVSIIQKRQKDFLALLEQVEALEDKIQDLQHESEMASLVINNQTSEDRLKDQIVDLRIENEQLKRQIKQLSSHKTITELPKVEMSIVDDFDNLLEEV